MNKKLTLSLDETIIEKAKIYAHNHKNSLSQLVEKYFQFITSENKVANKKYAPIVEDLLGSIEVSDDFDYGKTKYMYLQEKYD